MVDWDDLKKIVYFFDNRSLKDCRKQKTAKKGDNFFCGFDGYCSFMRNFLQCFADWCRLLLELRIHFI